jgi:Zn-dependent protease with chaperone function
MHSFELAPPNDVPADLAAPTPAYVRHARLAFLGVVLFLVVYLGLTAWFGAAVWRLTFAAPPEDRVLGFFISLPALFLFGFLLKGLFRIRSQPITGLIEVSADDQPDLIAFVHRVADQAGAPKPHRIFLAPAVNAAVFYDVGFLNLLFPSRKNLLIGMGLIETLTLDELRAVLAHEFGHFAQGTMRVGSWVYIARQVVADLITRRDAFDSTLAWIARADLRVAWIGWGMQIIVWSIRSILDTLFRGVMLLERALSREMEFQADLVAVSVSGSDSLVHALHCLGAADDAFDRALQFSAAEVRAGHPVEDLFAVQSRVLARMAEVLGDPTHGRAPPLPAADRASHRVFEAGIAEAPPMWSTHPPNHEREANAKRRYVASVLDARSAWAVVRDAPGLRQRVTRDLLELELKGGKQYHPVPLDETFARLDAQFDRPHLAPALRGAYVNRDLARHAEHPSALRDPAPIPMDSLTARLDALYPPSLPQDLERVADLAREHAQLQGMRAGALKATGGVLRFRGREVNAGELPELVNQVAAELAAARDAVHAHDREVRAVHRAAAEAVEPEWVPQLDGLLALVHYAEHARADLDDATQHLRHVVSVVTADGAVSSREMNHLMEAALEAHVALDAVARERGTFATGSAVRSRLRATWTDAVPGRARMPEPEPGQIGEWLQAFDVTAPMLSSALGALRNHALDELIATEARIARAWRGEEPAGDPPEGTPAAPPAVPAPARREGPRHQGHVHVVGPVLARRRRAPRRRAVHRSPRGARACGVPLRHRRGAHSLRPQRPRGAGGRRRRRLPRRGPGAWRHDGFPAPRRVHRPRRDARRAAHRDLRRRAEERVR